MAGKYNGLQAILTEENTNCISFGCGNHTLNLVGTKCAEACTVPTRKTTFLRHFIVSKTRWPARIDSERPVARYLGGVRNAVSELSDATN